MNSHRSHGTTASLDSIQRSSPHSNRKRLIRGVLGAILLISLSFVILWRAPREPMWNGKPTTYWISRLNYFDKTSPSAEKALYAVGPAIVPDLIHGLSLRDHWVYDQWASVYFKLGRWQRYFRMPIKRAHYRANCARGLALLGQAAAQAVPALLVALDDKDLQVRSAAAEALGRIGAEKLRVVPKLVAGASVTNSSYRLGCVIGLCHVLPDPKAAAALRTLINDADPNIRSWAAMSLWRDDSDPKTTSAALIAALNDGMPNVRSRAAQSLGKLRYERETSARALIGRLEAECRPGGDKITTWKLVTSLGELGATATSAVPLLAQLATNATTTGTLSIVALVRIQPQEAHWIEKLVEQLDHDNAFWAAWELGRQGQRARGAVEGLRRIAESSSSWGTRMMAATAAWRLDPSSPNPLEKIRDELPEQEGGHFEVIRLLGELGPAAQIAIPALLELRSGHGIMAHDSAVDVLQVVAPKYISNPWSN